MLKHLTISCLLMITFILSNSAFSQQSALTVKNIKFESSNSLTFDVFVKNTGASSWTFSHSALVWTYDNTILNGGTPSFTIVPGYSELTGSAQPPSALITSPNILRTSSNMPGSYEVLSSGQSLRIGRFRLQTTAAAFSSSYFNISWKNSGTPYTRLFDWNSISGLPAELTSPEFVLEQPLLVENFEFTGLLNANGWTTHSGTTNFLSTTDGLSYTNYPGSGVGNAVLIGNAGGEDVNRGITKVSANSVYFSLLVNVNDTASNKSGDYFFHIGDRSTPTTFTSFSARVFAKVVGGNVNFGLSNTSTATYGTTNFSKNQTYLLIAKYTINTAGVDTVSLWVVSSGVPATEIAAGTPEIKNVTTTGQDSIDAVGIRQGSSSTQPRIVADGIRIAKTWTDLFASSAGPTLTAVPSALSNFTYFVGSGPSVSQSYTLTGSELTPASGNIVVTGSTNYEVSTNNSTFSNSVNVAYSGAAFSTTIYVRLKAGLPGGFYNGEIVTNAGGGAATFNVTCSGAVIKPQPSNHVTDFAGVLGNPNYHFINLSWVDATGSTVPDGYLIKGSDVGFASIIDPVDGTPENNSVLVQNVAEGIQNFSFGLNSGTTYYFKIYPYTNSSTTIDYKTDGTIPQVSLATSSAPVLPVTENFDYTTGSPLTSNGWVAHSGVGTNPILVNNTPLSYSGYVNSGVGKSVTMINTGEDDNRAFLSVTANSVYASFMVNITAAQTAGDYIFHFAPENSTTLFYGKVFVKKNAGDSLAFGIAKNVNGSVVYTPFNFSLNTTYLVAVKYTFNSATTTDDEVKLWVNPVLDGTEPAADVTQTDAGTDALSLGMFALRQGTAANAANLILGGLRVADSWIPGSAPTTFQLTVSVANGWNTVSIPGLHPVDQNVLTWWSGKDPAAGVFKFNNGYVPVTTVTPGTGYWMKHSGAKVYNTGDEWPAGGIQIVAHSPISGNTGWNLFGGYETTVATSGITTTPSGLQTGSVFGYTPAGGYQVSSNLVPGYGYWIKLTGAGQINIPASLSKGNVKQEDYIKSDWGKIVITDAEGKHYTLYAVTGQVNLGNYELPPAPFADMFDVRYGSGRIAEDLSSAQLIEMQGMVYPVKVRVEGVDVRMQDETGNGINSRLRSGEELLINNSSISKLMVSGDMIPDKYSLEQNYPNPFNPSTKIEFSLPEDANNVRLTIYDALGQKVEELVNGKLEAGKYNYVWNAGNVATGLYIYELRTDKFVSVKKMMLLK